MPPSSLALSPRLISVAVTTNRMAGRATPQTAAAIGQRGLAPVGEVAGDELALELDAGDEEEDGEQAVGRPGAEREVEVQGGGPTTVSRRVGVAVAPRRVGPDERGDRGGKEDRAADGLGAKQVGDVAGLAPAAPAEEALAAGVLAGGPGGPGWSGAVLASSSCPSGRRWSDADQTSRHTRTRASPRDQSPSLCGPPVRARGRLPRGAARRWRTEASRPSACRGRNAKVAELYHFMTKILPTS